MGARGPEKGTDSAKAGKGYKRITVGNAVPPPPPFLGKIAQEEYLRLAEVMAESFTGVDYMPLMLYAADYEQVVKLTEQIAKEGINLEGDRGVVLNPAVKALDMAQKRMLKTAQALGLTRPAASTTPNVELQSGGAKKKKRSDESEGWDDDDEADA